MADDHELVSVHQNLGRPRPSVVIGRERVSVHARAGDRKKVAPLDFGKGPVLREKIRGLADRPDHVAKHGRRQSPAHGHDLMKGVVQARPDEVVHARVHDGEPPGVRRLRERHPRDQHARVRDEVPARLENQLQPEFREQGEHGREQRLGRRGRVLSGFGAAVLEGIIVDPEPSADVDEIKGDAERLERSDEPGQKPWPP